MKNNHGRVISNKKIRVFKCEIMNFSPNLHISLCRSRYGALGSKERKLING